jgi:hypothetical protein
VHKGMKKGRSPILDPDPSPKALSRLSPYPETSILEKMSWAQAR